MTEKEFLQAIADNKPINPSECNFIKWDDPEWRELLTLSFIIECRRTML